MIDGRNAFDQPEKSDMITHEIIRKIKIDHGDV